MNFERFKYFKNGNLRLGELLNVIVKYRLFRCFWKCYRWKIRKGKKDGNETEKRVLFNVVYI